MEVNAYLRRLEYRGSRVPNVATLRSLHRAHLLAVPFENLDIHLGRPIRLEAAALFEKIVRQRRGGFCYELNGLFALLLSALGFEVELLSARVMDEGQPGPAFDHLALLVKLEEPWLADVGFGDSFVEPLRLQDEIEQVQNAGAFRLLRNAEQWTLQARTREGDWQSQYLFTLTPHTLADFAGMCHYHQTSPASHFTQKRICTRATASGRLTLSERKLIITHHGERRETILHSEEDYHAALWDRFGIVLP